MMLPFPGAATDTANATLIFSAAAAHKFAQSAGNLRNHKRLLGRDHPHLLALRRALTIGAPPGRSSSAVP